MKALAIAVYMGQLPSLMPLWLRSAACNSRIDFLVVSDQAPPPRLPANVAFLYRSLDDLRQHWSSQVGFEVSLDRPYKLCDLKPLFWSLAPNLGHYDYWGFCDLDILFGDLNRLLGRRLGRYDILLSEGHLRFFRNDAAMREAWRCVRCPHNWQHILADPGIFGLDEHPGINRVFADSERSWFADPALVADIHPSFRQMRRLPHLQNSRRQAFYWDKGKVYREWVGPGRRVNREEYLYIHLQKRPLAIDPACLDAPVFNIDPAGIVPRRAGDDRPEAIARRNPWHVPDIAEARILLRQWRRNLTGARPDFPAVDRPGRAEP